MTMKRVLAGIMLLLLASVSAAAGVVGVRSGEHKAFSRLVFDLPGGGWHLGRGAGGYVLRFDDPRRMADVARVFRRIPHTRLAAIHSVPGEVTLTLGCVCHATGRMIDSHRLVVDISDGPPRPGSVFEQAISTPSDAVGTRPVITAPVVSRRPEARPVAPAFEPPPTRYGQLVLPALGGVLMERQGSTPSGSAAVVAPKPTDPPRQIPAARKLLLRQIARAASQGLLAPAVSDLALKKPKAQPPATNPQPPATPPPPASSGAGAPPPSRHGLNLQAQTAIDRSVPASTAASALSDAGLVCLKRAELDVSSWGDGRTADAQLADHRRGLYGEFDRRNEKRMIQLARLYLYLGFGAEAQVILDMSGPAKGPRKALYRALAEITDHGAVRGYNPFAGQFSCDTPAAMWAMLSVPKTPRKTAINGKAVLRAFSRLPPQLRRLFGPALARRFLAKGDTESATGIVRAVNRGTLKPTPALTLASAEIDLADGRDAEAAKRLRRVLSGNGRSAPEALALYMQDRLAAGRPVAPRLIDSAATYAFELKSSPLGKKLKQMQILALGAAGRFDEAFAELDKQAATRRSRLDPAPDYAGLFWQLAKASRNRDLLRFTLSHRDLIPSGPRAIELRRALARRLLVAGFPQQAANIIKAGSGDAGHAGAMIGAQIALALGKPQVTLDALDGDESEQARRLREKALEMQGRFAAALKAVRGLPADPLAVALAWKLGDWPKIRVEGSPAQRRFAAALTGAGTGAGVGGAARLPAGSLAQARALVAGSARMRALLGDILAGH